MLCANANVRACVHAHRYSIREKTIGGRHFKADKFCLHHCHSPRPCGCDVKYQSYLHRKEEKDKNEHLAKKAKADPLAWIRRKEYAPHAQTTPASLRWSTAPHSQIRLHPWLPR